jgi:asparagine synthase (glutamine-hydrolysing)
MQDRLPRDVIQRPKMGFGIPIDQWLRGPFRALVELYLSAGSLQRGGVFDAGAVTRLVSEHLEGRRDHGTRLWLVLQFQIWRERWGI